MLALIFFFCYTFFCFYFDFYFIFSFLHKKSTFVLDFFGRDRWSRTTDDGVKVRCLTAWLYPYIKLKMGRVVGFEPTHNGATIRRVNHFTIPATCRPCRTTSIITYIYFIRQLVGLKKSFRFFCSFLKFYAFFMHFL